jgi:hypothetical protein
MSSLEKVLAQEPVRGSGWRSMESRLTVNENGTCLVAIGDISCVAHTCVFAGNGAYDRAEQYAANSMGREWGDSEITLAKLYVSDGSEWVLGSEWEF